MMSKKVLGIYGSPRKRGNTDQLLDKALEGARSAGAETHGIHVRDLKMSGCIECGGCDKTGKCVVKDDMQKIMTQNRDLQEKVADIQGDINARLVEE